MPALFSRKDGVRRLLRRVQTSAVQLHPPRPGAGCGTARTLNHGLHYTASLCWAWHGAAPEAPYLQEVSKNNGDGAGLSKRTCCRESREAVLKSLKKNSDLE